MRAMVIVFLLDHCYCADSIEDNGKVPLDSTAWVQQNFSSYKELRRAAAAPCKERKNIPEIDSTILTLLCLAFTCKYNAVQNWARVLLALKHRLTFCMCFR